MIAACETELAGELFLVEPPRRIHMSFARPVLIERRKVLKKRYLPVHTAAHRVHQIAADFAARVGKPVRMPRALRIEQDTHRLTRACGENDRSRGCVAYLAVCSVDEG